MKLTKYHVLFIVALMICLSVLYTYKQLSRLEITGVDGRKIITDAYVLTDDHELMLPKAVAEQVLNAHMRSRSLKLVRGVSGT